MFVYGSYIPIIKDTYLFKEIGSYFHWRMANSMVEQTLLFFTLLLFWNQIGIYYKMKNQNKKKPMLTFFEDKIKNKGYWGGWRLIY